MERLRGRAARRNRRGPDCACVPKRERAGLYVCGGREARRTLWLRSVEEREEAMPKIGILCDREEEKKTITDACEFLAAREGFGCSLCHVCQGSFWRDSACVILDWGNREAAFSHAEQLWDKEPNMPILYVAHSAEDVLAALRLPFFHTVRSFDLEQDLSAAFRKLGRLKSPFAERLCFTRNGRPVLVSRKELLYLESEHHNILLHVGAGVLPISETLAQCEEKLKGMGFVRTYRSFLVNMYHIRCLEKESALLDNGERIYVSRRRYPEVKLTFESYIRHLDFLS